MPRYSKTAVDRIATELRALEHEAGIEAAVDRACEGRFFPDLSATAEEYYLEEYLYTRRRLRSAYFGVQDKDLRKKLIRKRGELEREDNKKWDEWTREARAEVSKAKRAGGDLPWLMAAAIGAGAVAIGHSWADTTGAIGGAVVGLFLGAGAIANARSQAQRKLEDAEALLAQAIADQEKAMSWPDTFSDLEEFTGEPEEGAMAASDAGNESSPEDSSQAECARR